MRVVATLLWCPRCRGDLGPVVGTVASCQTCRRAYVVVTDDERAANLAARKARKR